jgi:hypothetical protein
MYALVVAAIAVAPAQPPAKHEAQNPLLKRLIDTGIDTGGKEKVKFPEPVMPDGLTAARQNAVVKKFADEVRPPTEFTRNSVVAREVTKIHDISGGDPKAPTRAVDVYFIVYGDFKKLQDDKFLDRLVGTSKGTNSKGGELKQADLTKRGIKLDNGNAKTEGYGFVEFDFLGKVRLKATGHAMWTRTDESVVAAAEIDPRFLKDKEFPNEWRAITNAGGKVQLGNPHPWTGAAMYLKITKLANPAGAMFVEQHIIFAEPQGWFGGANLLGAKLPAAVQDNVRTMRKEFQK